MARLLSVNVGLPRDIEWQGKTVHTAVWKTPVQGRPMSQWPRSSRRRSPHLGKFAPSSNPTVLTKSGDPDQAR